MPELKRWQSESLQKQTVVGEDVNEVRKTVYEYQQKGGGAFGFIAFSHLSVSRTNTAAL